MGEDDDDDEEPAGQKAPRVKHEGVKVGMVRIFEYSNIRSKAQHSNIHLKGSEY